MTTIPVELHDRKYFIDIARDSLDRSGVALASLGDVSRVLLVSDDVVDPIYGEKVSSSLVDRGLDVDVFIIPAGEESKSIDMAFTLWEGFLSAGADRHSVAVALGGGVVGDLTGFVAATYARGIRFFQIPTTLLAQVDSSVGGKTAINLPHAKNMVGSFYQPSGVLIDPNVLKTLSEEQYRSGLGEVVKYGASLDQSFFLYLESHADDIVKRDAETLETVIAKCCAIKAKIVADDEKEISGRRALLNYGHTFGHALESVLGHGAIPHGYGVLIGSILAAQLARRLAQKGDYRFSAIDDAWIERQRALYAALNLPATIQDIGRSYKDDSTTPERIVQLAMKDKKAKSGKLNFILPTGLGQCVYAKNIAAEDVCAVLK